MSAPHQIAVLNGDGVGPEVTRATTEVLLRVAEATGLSLELNPGDVGWIPYRAVGSTLPDSTQEVLERCTGWIMGPTAAGDYPKDDPVKGHPSGFLRRHYELFGNVRPVHAWPQLPALVPELDTTIIRENTEGFYPDRNLHWGYGEFMPTADVAISLRVITKRACDRLARLSFEYAKGKDRKSLVVVHKRTALPQTDGLFIAAFEEIKDEFPDVAVEYMRIDTFSSLLAKEPERFGLVATTNLFGDIMSDQASGLVGGVGLAPSVNIGAEHVMAQAVHGTAEDIAGKNIVNPAPLMLSTALMLGRLGQMTGDSACTVAAKTLEDAVAAALSSGRVTGDLGGTATTEDFTAEVLSSISPVGVR